MEIEDIRKELNHLLNSVVDHSTKYSSERPIPSLEISFVLTKINKMQENLSVLKHLLTEHERASKRGTGTEKKALARETVAEKTESINVERSDPTDKLDQTPIPKLIDALTLNDRYLFANELFNKDMNKFNDFIKTIDSITSLEEAKKLVSELDLDEENEQIQVFVNLIERRFL